MKYQLLFILLCISSILKASNLYEESGYYFGVENYDTTKSYVQRNQGQDNWTIYIEGLSALITNSYTMNGNIVGDPSDISSFSNLKDIGSGRQWRFTYKNYGTYNITLIGPTKNYVIKMILTPKPVSDFEGLLYYLNSNNQTAEVIDFFPNESVNQSYVGGELLIPSEITSDNKTYTVISIGNSAFRGCSGLTSVTIPNSVTSIGDYAFSDCSSIKEVTIEDGDSTLKLGEKLYSPNVTGIGLFGDCPLEKVYIGRNLSYSTAPGYGYSPFANQKNLSSMIFGNTVTSLNSYLLYNCSGLTNVTIPNSVSSIGDYAFNGCSSIKEVTIEDGESTLRLGSNYSSGQFDSCPLEKVYIGRNLSYSSPVSSNFYSPFANQKNLSSVIFGNTVTSLNSCLLYNCSALTSITIPNSVTSIRGDAFLGCSSIKEVTIEDGDSTLSLGNNPGAGSGQFGSCPLETVYIGRNLSYPTGSAAGSSPFANQKNLTEATIGNSVTSIGDNLFYKCSGLTSITIPNSVISIGEDAFSGCSGLTSITIPIPNSVTTIGNYAFNGCSGLTSIPIPNSVTSIGYYAFYGCSALTSVTIPNSVSSIGSSAFSGCSSIKEVTIEDGESTLNLGYNSTSSGQFGSCPLEKVYIGRNLSYYSGSSNGYSPFANQKNLSSVIFGNTVTSLNSYLLYNCSALTSITIPNSVASIGNYAFSDCSGLTSFTIPNSVTSIGSSAFSGCSGLTSITIPNSVTSIGSSAFSGCSSIKEVTVEDGESTLSLGYNSYSSYGVGIGLFDDCPLEKVYIGRNLSYSFGSSYGYSPFANQKGLKEVIFGNTIKSLNSYLLYNCSGLTSVTIPNSVTSIGNYAFFGCSGLTNITISNSVTSIGNYAFSDCSSIKEVTIEDGDSTLSLGYNSSSSGQFGSCPLETVYIGRNLSYPTGSSYGYSPFANQKNLTEAAIGNSVTSIGDYLFYKCSGLTNITISNSVTSIGDYAFNGCSSIKEVTIEDGDSTLSLGYNSSSSGQFGSCPLETVYIGRNLSYPTGSSFGYSPFANQKNLSSVIFGNTVTSLNSYLLYNCSSLTSITIPNSITSIGDYAFNSCSSIKEVTIEDGESTLRLGSNYSSGQFDSCPLEKVYIGRNLSYSSGSSYGYSPFANQKDLKEVIFGNTITSLNSYLLYNCSALTSITIPNSVTSIGNSAFNGCTSLKEVNFEEDDDIITLGYNTYSSSGTGKGLFADCPLETLYVGRDIEYSNYNSSYPWSSYPSRYGYSAFAAQEILNDVKFGTNCNSIPSYSFYNCKSLNEIKIPQSVESMGKSAFEGCSELTNIEMPNFIKEMAENLLAGCAKLESIEIPNSVENIGNYAFSCCSSLNELSIPASVLSIGNFAFHGCLGITSLELQTGASNLQLGNNGASKGLFSDCPLEKVGIGRNLTYSNASADGYSPFCGIQTLKIVDLKGENLIISENLFQNCTGIETFVIPGIVNSIEANAFNNCSALKTVKYSPVNDFASLDANAFDTNFYLYESLILDNKDLTLDILDDANWNKIRHIFYVENNMEYVPVKWDPTLKSDNIFYQNNNGALAKCGEDITLHSKGNVDIAIYSGEDILAELNSKEGFNLIPQSEWQLNYIYGVSNGDLSKEVTLNSAASLFNEVGLQNIEKITSLKIHGYINGTDVMTINRMTSLQNLDISDCHIVEGGQTYRDGLKTSDNVVGSYFFYNCDNLRNVILPLSAIEIESSAFENRSSICNLILSPETESIGSKAFDGCSSLVSFRVPAKVTGMSDNFKNCTSLINLSFDDSELIFSFNGTSSDLFKDCPLQNIYIGRNLSYNTTSNYDYSPFYNRGILYVVFAGNASTVPAYILSNCKDLQRVDLSNTLIEISTHAFDGCIELADIVLPENLERLGSYAFNNCKSLIEMNLPANLTEIPEHCFSGCEMIGDFSMGNDILNIGTSAFEGCISLSTLGLSNSLSDINESAFSGCSGLSVLSIPGSVEKIGNYVFNGCESLSNIRFENGSNEISLGYNYNYSGNGKGLFYDCPLSDVYLGRDISYSTEASKGYSPFAYTGVTTLNIGSEVNSLGNNIFMGCASLKELDVPNNITNIGSYAFNGCSSLTDAILSNALTSIPSYCFAECSALTNLRLGTNLTSINNTAFQNCSSLAKIVSLNPTPPVITTQVFWAVNKETCLLVVTKGNLVYYWLDPVWKEFLNMSDDLIFLNPLPSATYGEDAIDLAEYAPADVTLTYETSNPDVARIDGSLLTIVGAGTATIGAIYDTNGAPMEIIGQMRQLVIEKADLNLAPMDCTIEYGSALPEFTLFVDGLCYDDTLEDVGELPEFYCEADETSEPGDYPIYLVGGESNNYNLNLVAGTLKIVDKSDPTSVEDVIVPQNGDNRVKVFNLNGVLVFEGDNEEMNLSSGVYIIVTESGKTYKIVK